MQIFNHLFGGGMTSKLFNQVREKMSLCYAIGSGYIGAKGIVTVNAGVDSDKCELVKQEVLHQLQLCCDGEITETELTKLENNLTELKTINEALRTACSGQQIKAAELQVKLTKAEELSRTLQSQLADLQTKSTRQEALLTQANESLKEYAAEEKRTRLRIKAQRNMWEAMAGAMLIGMIAK